MMMMTIIENRKSRNSNKPYKNTYSNLQSETESTNYNDHINPNQIETEPISNKSIPLVNKQNLNINN